jgi:hypothetical protein
MEWQMDYGTDSHEKTAGGKKNPGYGDMRGRRIEIGEGAMDIHGNPVPKGEAYMYNGSTGTISADYAAIVLPGDVPSLFSQIRKRYIIKGL